MMSRHALQIFVLLCSYITCQPAVAVIFGGTDNRPMNTDGWQEGAAAVFNVPGRVAYWEGPPFGGGQYRSECRGDAAAFNSVLSDFAKIKAAKKLLTIRDGYGQSVWLNINREPDKAEQARIDWVFMAWKIENWKRIRSFPADLRPADVSVVAKEPVPQIDVYLGGQIDWSDVSVPEGITVDDQRMSAHGFSVEDGRVFQGKLIDQKTGSPLAGRIEVRQRLQSEPSEKSKWTTIKAVQVEGDGEWTITKAPSGRVMLVAIAPEYADRILGYESVSENSPGWSRHDNSLVKASRVVGRVVDSAGNAIEGAAVALSGTTDDDGNKYTTTLASRHEVDAEGRFIIEGVPTGWANVWPMKDGYIAPEGRRETIIPSNDVTLVLARAGTIDAEVDFSAYADRNEKRPDGYIVNIEQAPGSETKSRWGGSGNIDESNKRVFKNVPAGRYVLNGRPNPGSARETTVPVSVEVKAGETSFVTLIAK